MLHYIHTIAVPCICFFQLEKNAQQDERHIYQDIFWPVGYENMAPVQRQGLTLPHSSVFINNFCITRVQHNGQNTHIFEIFDERGSLSCQFFLWYHTSHKYLKASIIDKLLRNESGLQSTDWFKSLEIDVKPYETTGIGIPLAFQSLQSEQFIKPDHRALTFFILNDYAFTIYADESGMAPEQMLHILRQWTDTQKGKLPAKVDPLETERRKKLYDARVAQVRKEEKQNSPLYAPKKWNELNKQSPREFTRIFWDNANYGYGIEKTLKLEPLPQHNTIPNINTGVGCQPFLEQLIQKGFKLMARKGGDYLMTATLKDKKTSIRYCIYHAFNPTDARQALFAWNMYADESGTPRIVEKPGDFTMQAAIDNMNVHPGWVGDFDICTKPRFNWEGTLVEGSEKSAIYFMRGNTAAYFIADNPSYDVLPLARTLDEQLKKDLEQPADTTKASTDKQP